jgi:hypothetical protein
MIKISLRKCPDVRSGDTSKHRTQKMDRVELGIMGRETGGEGEEGEETEGRKEERGMHAELRTRSFGLFARSVKPEIVNLRIVGTIYV